MRTESTNHYGLPFDIEAHQQRVLPKQEPKREIIPSEAAIAIIDAVAIVSPISDIDQFAENLGL